MKFRQLPSKLSSSSKKHKFIYFHVFALGHQVNVGVPGEYERPGVSGFADPVREVFAYALKGCGFEFLFYI